MSTREFLIMMVFDKVDYCVGTWMVAMYWVVIINLLMMVLIHFILDINKNFQW